MLTKSGKLVKSVIRVATFMCVSSLAMNIIDQVMPENGLTKIGKIGLTVAEVILAETIGFEAVKFVDGIMDGTVMGTVLFGKDEIS